MTQTELLFLEIKKLFQDYFDHPWLINVTSFSEIGTIRAFLSLSPREEDREYHLVLTGIRALRKFVRILRSTAVPGIHYNPHENKDLLLLKKCIIYTLPENTKKLDYLSVEFEKTIMRQSLLTQL